MIRPKGQYRISMPTLGLIQYGVIDLLGNVWEWCSRPEDWVGADITSIAIPRSVDFANFEAAGISTTSTAYTRLLKSKRLKMEFTARILTWDTGLRHRFL